MSFQDIKDSLFSVVKTMGVVDFIDILLLTYIVYLLLKLIRETRAGQLMKGIVLLVIAYVVAKYVELKSITYIIKQALDVGLIALLILFQPELRRALEKV